MDAQEFLKQWQQAEAAVRKALAPPGVASKEQLRERSGLEFLGAIASGSLPSPPIGELIGFVPIEYEAGRVVFQGTPGANHYNPLGTVHGGYAATLLDSFSRLSPHLLRADASSRNSFAFVIDSARPVESVYSDKPRPL